MTTLGSTGKTDPSKFDGKKKLFLVPLIPMANLVLEKDKDLFDRHWNEISQQIDNLEVGYANLLSNCGEQCGHFRTLDILC